MGKFTDANELVLVGENPYMMVFEDDDAPMTTHVSFWRARLSPAGPGNAVFWKSELTDDQPRILSDNIALARWLQQEILPPSLPYGDLSIPVTYGSFTRLGDLPWQVTERVSFGTQTVEFSWYDFLPAFNGRNDPDPGEAWGHTASYVPARRIRVALDGREAVGQPKLRDRDGYQNTTCFLALAESWVKVRDQ